MPSNLRIVSNPVMVGTLKRLQADTAAELDALLPAILQSSPGFDSTGDRAFKGGLSVGTAAMSCFSSSNQRLIWSAARTCLPSSRSCRDCRGLNG